MSPWLKKNKKVHIYENQWAEAQLSYRSIPGSRRGAERHIMTRRHRAVHREDQPIIRREIQQDLHDSLHREP